MPPVTRTIRVKFDGTAKGLIAAAAKAGIAVEGFEKQVKKSTLGVTGMAGKLADGVSSAFEALPGVVKLAAGVAAAGIGVSMAPGIAAGIISGVLLAVGGGVLAAGIAGAAKDPRVAKAWKKFGRQAQVVFERFSKPFVKPMERAAKTFGQALARMEPTIGRIGAAIAPVIDKFAPGLAGMFENMLPGLLSATEAAAGLFGVLAEHLPGIGTAISGFFTAISANAPLTAQFFGGFLQWVQDILPKLGEILAWVRDLGPKLDSVKEKLAPIKDALAEVGRFILEGFKEAREKLHEWLDKNRDKVDKFIVQVSGFIKDTGPAFKLTILGIAFAFALFASNVILLVDALDKLKRWYNNNKSWLQIFTILPIAGGGAISGKLPGKASGGPVDAGRSYLVGEEGPEILRMGSHPGTIIPNDEISTGSGSMPPIFVENHIEIGGEVVRVVRTEIRESNRGLRRAVLAGAGAR